MKQRQFELIVKTHGPLVNGIDYMYTHCCSQGERALAVPLFITIGNVCAFDWQVVSSPLAKLGGSSSESEIINPPRLEPELDYSAWIVAGVIR